MVNSFSFARLPLIYFGPGMLDLLPGQVKKTGKRILLVTGRQSFIESARGQQLLSEFTSHKIEFHHVAVPGEPSPAIVDQAVSALRENNIDAVVAVGGGSAIDAGKAISAMLLLKGNLKEYLEGVGTKVHPGVKVPFIAVPTTSGTGSESTKNAVISETGEKGYKKSLRHDNFVPDIAIIDPLLVLSCPAEITAASGMDCFTQLIEAFLSNKSTNYTDALAVEGIKEVKSSLVTVSKIGGDVEARSGMAFAALTSGICLANAGLGAVHGFASSVGALYGIPHGMICGTLMAKANEVNVKVLRRRFSNDPALKKYALLGRLFLKEENRSSDYYIDGFIEYLHGLTDILKMPLLRDSGIASEDAVRIAKATEVKNNPVQLSEEELEEIIACRI